LPTSSFTISSRSPPIPSRPAVFSPSQNDVRSRRNHSEVPICLEMNESFGTPNLSRNGRAISRQDFVSKWRDWIFRDTNPNFGGQCLCSSE
jgi:hypothetical protein